MRSSSRNSCVFAGIFSQRWASHKFLDSSRRAGFGGETLLPSSEPRRLGQTPLSGTQVPQRLLMRLRCGEILPRPAGPRASETPEFVEQAAIICAVLTPLTAFRPCFHADADAPLRAAQIIATILRTAPAFHESRAAELSRFVRTAAAPEIC